MKTGISNVAISCFIISSFVNCIQHVLGSGVISLVWIVVLLLEHHIHI